MSESMIKLPPFYAICNRYKEIISLQLVMRRATKHFSTLTVLLYALSSVPVENDYGMAGELSRGSELPNSFMNRSRWPELYENILQGG
jgi:hypothetical protein